MPKANKCGHKTDWGGSGDGIALYLTNYKGGLDLNQREDQMFALLAFVMGSELIVFSIHLLYLESFSLFSVVQFDNVECTTTIEGGNTFGTCLTSTECGDRGGVNQGNCASGFGVCCFVR